MLAAAEEGEHGGEAAFTAHHTPNKEAASEQARVQRRGTRTRRAQVCRHSP
jgi:hypothetical protein